MTMPFPDLAVFSSKRLFRVRKRGSHTRRVVVFNLPLDLFEVWLVK